MKNIQAIIPIVALSLLVLSLIGCSTISTSIITGIYIKKDTPRIIISDRQQGWGYYSHGNLIQYDDDLIAIYYCTEGDSLYGPHISVDEDGNYLPGRQQGRGPCYSTDRGQTWRAARPLLKGVQKPILSPLYRSKLSSENPAYFTSAFYYQDDRRIVFHQPIFAYSGHSEFNAIGSVIRRDETRNWTSGEDVLLDVRGPTGEPLETELILGPRGVVMPDGSLIAVGYTRWNGKYNKVSSGYLTLAIISTDNGKTFKTLSIIATEADAPWGNEGPSEPSIVRLENGDLLCVMRTGCRYGSGDSPQSHVGDHLLQAISSDGGVTWAKSKMLIRGVMPRLLLMQNGLLAMSTGRPGNNIYISRDNGKHWIVDLAITRADMKTTGYCDMVEVEPGKLLVTYDVMNSPKESLWLWEPTYINGLMSTFVTVQLR